MKLNKISQVLLAAACFGAGAAQANTVTFDLTNIASTSTNLQDALMSFEQFNPSWGTLTGVELDLFSDVTTKVTLTNNNTATKTGDVTVHATLSLKDPLGNTWGTSASLIPGNLSVGPKVGITPGSATESGSKTLSASQTYSGAQLASFIGTGNLNSTLNVTATTQFNVNKVKASYDTHANGYGHVIYTFTSPVPEPETYGMLLLGLGLIGFAAKRSKRAA